MSLLGKVITVVGGSTGIGAFTAKHLARAGASIVLADVNREKGNEVVEAIHSTKAGKAMFVQCDVRKQDEVDALIKACVDEHGRLDGAFNNVGVPGDFVPLHQLEPESMLNIIDTNLAGVIRLMKAQVGQMLTQGPGEPGCYSIVNTTSTMALQPSQTTTSYAASKAGVMAATRAVAGCYGGANIRVNDVMFTCIDGTPMVEMGRQHFPDLMAQMEKEHAMKRFGTLEEVANAVEFLLSSKSKFITAQTLGVDGGFLNTSGNA